MSERRLPHQPQLHSNLSVSIGARLSTGRGAEHARLLWFVIVSYSRWPGKRERPMWRLNETLAADTGLDEARHVQQALTVLRAAEMVTTPTGYRPGAVRPYGRLLVPRLAGQVKVLIPARHDMANLWALCLERRKRPAPMVTMMTGAYALACDANGGRPFDEWAPLGCTMADWRRFVGARKNASWTKRVRECEALDLIRRKGRAVEVAPTRSWLRAARSLDSWVESRGPPLAHSTTALKSVLANLASCRTSFRVTISHDSVGPSSFTRSSSTHALVAGSLGS